MMDLRLTTVDDHAASRGYSFGSFVADLAHAIRSSRDGAEAARDVRLLLTEAIRSDTFLLDCIERAASAMVPPLSSWTNPPLLDDDELACSVRLFYWPPHFSNSPHQHTFWTVTGVLSGELTFTTYRGVPASDIGDFTVDREYRGTRGDVGYILPPCIHQVSNHSGTPSVSVHVFSGPKVPPEQDGIETQTRGRTTWYDLHPPAGVPLAGVATYVLDAQVALLESIGTADSLELLDRVFQLGDLRIQLASAKAMSRLDPARAGRRLLDLSTECAERDASRLRALARRLLDI